MPAPASRTFSTIDSSILFAQILIRPRWGENFTAFDNKLSTIVFIFVHHSPSHTSSGQDTSVLKPLLMTCQILVTCNTASSIFPSGLPYALSAQPFRFRKRTVAQQNPRSASATGYCCCTNRLRYALLLSRSARRPRHTPRCKSAPSRIAVGGTSPRAR